MTRAKSDVLVAGAGIAGLIAATALAQTGLKVTVVDPVVPKKDNPDLRSTAYLAPAKALLVRVGLWEHLAPYATKLNALRVINCSNAADSEPTDRTFLPNDIDTSTFAWNVPNWRARSVLAERISNDANIDLRFGTALSGFLAREKNAIARLSDGNSLDVKLAVAADGRSSELRRAVGIDVRTSRYGQKALAFVVTHSSPHENVSTEVYNSGGAFTLVPIDDLKGRPASTVVWMNDGPETLRLKNLPSEDFSAAATARSNNVLGQLTLASERNLWPIVTQTAETFSAQRTVLIAEAAHVMPPIGAQGLNTSLQDIAVLADLALQHSDIIGTAEFLSLFESKRARDIKLRARIIDVYNRLCQSGSPAFQSLRSTGLRLVHDIKPIRQSIMRAGMGGGFETDSGA